MHVLCLYHTWRGLGDEAAAFLGVRHYVTLFFKTENMSIMYSYTNVYLGTVSVSVVVGLTLKTGM